MIAHCPVCGNTGIDEVRGYLCDLIEVETQPVADEEFDIPVSCSPERLYHIGWFCRNCNDYFGHMKNVVEIAVEGGRGH